MKTTSKEEKLLNACLFHEKNIQADVNNAFFKVAEVIRKDVGNKKEVERLYGEFFITMGFGVTAKFGTKCMKLEAERNISTEDDPRAMIEVLEMYRCLYDRVINYIDKQTLQAVKQKDRDRWVK